MQSVPSEFVAQLRPLLFVAGLGAEGQQDAAGSSTTAAAAAAAASSTSTTYNVDGAAGPTPATETAVDAGPAGVPEGTSAASSLNALPQGSPSQQQQRPSAFALLVQSLREVLTAKRAFHIYDNPALQRGHLDFHVSLVDKSIRFPPRKARLPNNQIGSHSPISPFSPTSPLYPDGIMAPIWIRKHRELIPSVFVLVLRLYEFGLSNEDGTAPSRDEIDIGPLEKEKIERLRDNELVNEILNRKRSCAERGIKLAVVLLTSRDMLDDPTLDTRLSHIRRLSTLDSRASLFVLSPVPTSEVQNFVQSLKAELAESSIDYYREHGRRLRRKRSRPASSLPSFSPAPSPNPASQDGTARSPPRSITQQALNVRHEYKAAVFAEFRGETEVALKHYEDCYFALVDLFTQPVPQSATAATGTLPTAQPLIHPRTKRWAEAKVLADCIAIKLCKMYLYSGNSPYAIQTYRQHVKRFAKISADRWGMDEQSFEYWSWASKQHRMFADLVESATRAGYQLPTMPAPTPGPPLHARASAQHAPDAILQHPGVYYYVAGLCAVRRRDCFREADALASEALSPPAAGIDDAAASGGVAAKPSAALSHERSVNHAEQIVELFTKAYEHFKRHHATRMTLLLADSISAAHESSANWELCLRFDERIAKTYRRERWNNLLDGTLDRSAKAAAAQALVQAQTAADEDTASSQPQSAPIETALRLKLEHESLDGLPAKASQSLRSTLVPFADSLPDAGSPVSPVTIDSETTPLPFTCQCTFWETTADLGQLVPFQIVLASPLPAPAGSNEAISVQGACVHWSDGRGATVVRQDKTETSRKGFVALGSVLDEKAASTGREADLTFSVDGTLVFYGSILSTKEQSLQLKKVSLQLQIGSRQLTLDLRPGTTRSLAGSWLAVSPDGKASDALRLPPQLDHSACRFHLRQLSISLVPTMPAPAYLNEAFPILLAIRNNDKVAISIGLTAALHPTAQTTALQGAALDDALSLGTSADREATVSSADAVQSLAAGDTCQMTLYLHTKAIPGPRSIDVDAVCRPVSSAAAEQADGEYGVAPITLSQRLTIQVVHPFFCDFRSDWFYSPLHRAQRSDVQSAEEKSGYGTALDMQRPDPWRGSVRCLLDVTTGALGPTQVDVVDVRLNLEHQSTKGQVRQARSSLADGDGQLPDTWHPIDPFSVLYELDIQPMRLRSEGILGYLEIDWRRHSSDATSDSSPANKTTIPIPALTPPPALLPTNRTDSPPLVTVTHPMRVRLHEPFEATYRLVLPSPFSEQTSPREISFSVESASDNFVFTGPRKVARLLVLPDMAEPGGEVLATYKIIPMGQTGLVELPRFRAWELLESSAETADRRRLFEERQHQVLELDEEREPFDGPKMRELAVVRDDALVDHGGPQESSGPRVFVTPR